MAKHSNLKLNKALGQHFLTDQAVLQQIVKAVDTFIAPEENTVEVGPGAGALTQFIHTRQNFKLVEYDSRWVKHLAEKFPSIAPCIINEDFLKINLNQVYENMAIVGNFPYNISSQIMFKILDYKENVHTVVGMFQKEVAQRICATPKNKQYGILSVLLQAFYEAEYLFDVPREAFNPPPKVVSGVLVLRRKENLHLACDAKKFKQVVKLAFGQRRKTLRNSLKSILPNDEVKAMDIFNKRPEALSVQEFVALTQLLFPSK